MKLRFTKMHGAGNDFILINAVTQKVPLSADKVRLLADRHLGIGCDQLLVAEPPTNPGSDFRYRIYNCDGSEAENCGNGSRCFAQFVRAEKLTRKDSIVVDTPKGTLTLEVKDKGQVRVNMGEPILSPAEVPFAANEFAPSYPIDLACGNAEISAISMGNPHGVLVVDSVDMDVNTVAQQVRDTGLFANGVNVGFMEVVSPSEIKLRVVERGVGETLACGSGACAAVAAGQLRGLLDNNVRVHLPGGTLTMEWGGRGTPIYKTGPTKLVFQGQTVI